MIRVLVMANDSVLVAGITTTLAQEIDLDVVRVSSRELGKGDRYSVVIIVDEGESEGDAIKVSDLFREDVSLLLIKLSLKSRDVYVYESYQLNNPGFDRVIKLVRDFGKANLKKKVEEAVTTSPAQDMTAPRLSHAYVK